MKFSLNSVLPLRIYKNKSFPGLINLMLCNRIMKIKPVVANARTIYQSMNRLLPKKFVNYLVSVTFCKALTAGTTLQTAQQVSKTFRNQGIAIILDYCAQGRIDSPEYEAQLDKNAKLFALSAETLAKNQNEMISIKVTSLVDIGLLKKINESIAWRDQFWLQNSKEGILDKETFFSALKKIDMSISQQDFQQYLKLIHGYNGDPSEFKISEVDFKMNHHSYYLYEPTKNMNKIIRVFLPLQPSYHEKLQSFQRRLSLICSPHSENKNQFRILVDAEQSYVQLAIQSFSEQMQEKYNKKQLYIIPTIQNYLKRSVERSQYEIDIAKKKGLKFGAKLVRGAYIVEETELAEKNNTQNPIVENYEKTTENYLESFRRMVKQFSQGEVVVASHSEDTIFDTASIHKNMKSPIKVSFAQLYGLADHLTWKAREEGYRVYKYLPWAETQVMVDYMIRRAIQLGQMRYPLDTQYKLLTHELKSRVVG